MKLLDKLKNRIKYDKKLVLFLIILGIIGIAAGSIFVTLLNSNDTKMITEYLNNFLTNIQNNEMNYLNVLKNNLITNIFYVILIWLLGISIIGLPIILIIYFSKTFILGFSIGSIISVYKFKGILFAISYVFPGQILTLISISILTMYAISFSLKLIYAIFKRKTIDFKMIMNKYLIVLGIVLLIVVLSNLYDTFVIPNIIKTIMPFIK